MGFGLSGHVIELLNLQGQFSIWYFTSTISPLLVGPAIYYYVKILIKPDFRLRFLDIIHLLLPAVYLFRIYLAVSVDTEISGYRDDIQKGYSTFLWPAIKTISQTVYTLMALSHLKNHVNNLSNILSNLKGLRLSWLKNILLIFIFLSIFSWILFAYTIMYHPSIWADSLYSIGLSLIVIWISLRGYKQPEIFNGEIFDTVNKSKPNIKKSISDEEKLAIGNGLSLLVEKNRFYLDDAISLPKLAQLLGKRVQTISYYLNEIEQCNFYDYVNKLRTQSACKALEDTDDKRTILDIAFDNGFSNKSTFNSAFKKHIKMTPTEYRKKYA